MIRRPLKVSIIKFTISLENLFVPVQEEDENLLCQEEEFEITNSLLDNSLSNRPNTNNNKTAIKNFQQKQSKQPPELTDPAKARANR